MSPAASPADTRFWAKVDTSAGLLECWPWTGARDEHGYGRFNPGQQPTRAHRVSMAIALGRPLVSTEHVLHSCDNPPCVNPAHLHLGSHAENMREAAERGRMAHGEARPQAKLTAEVVLAIRAARTAGATWSAISRDFGVPIWTARSVVHTRWQHLEQVS